MDVASMILFVLLWVFIVGLNVVVLSYLSAKHKTSAYLIGAGATYIVLANVLATKIMQIGMFVVPAGVVVYSLIFLVNDVLSEKYGKKFAQRSVLTGFIMNIMFLLLIYLAILAPPLNTEFGVAKSESFKELFGLTAQIVFASLVAYIVSQTFNVFVYHAIKEKTQSKMMWLRNNLSTALSQFIDTVIFIGIGFYGVVSGDIMLNMILTQYVLKVLIAVLDTPFLYASTSIFERVRAR